MAKLTGSVGHLGDNRLNDTMLVQTLLNQHILMGGFLSGPALILTGSVDSRTIEAIRDFQDKIAGRKSPSGCIKPASDDFLLLEKQPKELLERILLKKAGFVDLYVLPAKLAAHRIVTNPVSGKYQGQIDPTFHEMHLPGARLVNDLADCLTVASEVTDHGRLKIRKLRIGSHGGGEPVGWFYIGSSEISIEQIDSGKLAKLHELGQYLVRGFSLVTIDACNTGLEKKLIRRLSTIWGGVAVKAFLSAQHSESTGSVDNGPYRTCQDQKCVVGFETPVLEDLVSFLRTHLH